METRGTSLFQILRTAILPTQVALDMSPQRQTIDSGSSEPEGSRTFPLQCSSENKLDHPPLNSGIASPGRRGRRNVPEPSCRVALTLIIKKIPRWPVQTGIELNSRPEKSRVEWEGNKSGSLGALLCQISIPPSISERLNLTQHWFSSIDGCGAGWHPLVAGTVGW